MGEVLVGKVESNDEIRIREMQEAQRQAEVRAREVDRGRRTEQSFREALKAQNAREGDKRAREQDEGRRTNERLAQRVLDQVRRDKPRHPHELHKRAALARALHGRSMLNSRANESQGQAQVLADRADHYSVGRSQENEHVEEALRDNEVEHAEAREERLEEVRRDAQATQLADAVDRERRRGHHGQDRRDSEEHGDRSSEPVQGPRAAAGASGPQTVLPPEVLKRIVGAITKVVDDGRTRLRIRFQGQGLDGVELDIRAENGEVACSFSGCSDRLRRDLEGAEAALGRALARRGLKLRKLEAL